MAGPNPRESPGHQPADVFVVFGITGDLAKVMTFRSLYRLERRGLLTCPIVGVAVDDWTDEHLRDHARDAIVGTGEALDEQVFDRFAARLSYVQGDFGDATTYERVGVAIKGAEQPVFYLEIPPFLFATVVDGLAAAGLTQRARVVIEKPFGHDLASARALAAELHQHLDESQIYRIDHFLGKMGLEELLYLRFANTILEPVWDRNSLECVEITMAESFGVEDRGHFYDPVGALRDVVVNHLMQLVSATAMESPARGDPETLKDAQLAVFRAVETADPAHYVRGQYDGYLDTAGGRPGLDHRDVRGPAPRHRELALVGGPVLHPHRQAPRRHPDRGPARLQAPAQARLRFTPDRRPEPDQLVLRLDPTTGVRLRLDARRADAPGPESITLDMEFARGGRRGCDAVRGAAPRRDGRSEHALHPAGRRRGDVADHAAAARRSLPPSTATRRDPGDPPPPTRSSPATAAGTPHGRRHDHGHRTARAGPRRARPCRRPSRRSRTTPSCPTATPARWSLPTAPSAGCACPASTRPACSARCSTARPGTSGWGRSASTSRRRGPTSRAPTSSPRRGTPRAAGSSSATPSTMGPRQGEDEVTPHTRPPADDDADHMLVRTAECIDGRGRGRAGVRAGVRLRPHRGVVDAGGRRPSRRRRHRRRPDHQAADRHGARHRGRPGPGPPRPAAGRPGLLRAVVGRGPGRARRRRRGRRRLGRHHAVLAGLAGAGAGRRPSVPAGASSGRPWRSRA